VGEQPLPALIENRHVRQLLGVSTRTVQVWAARGILPAIKLGENGRWRFPRTEIEKLAAGERNGGHDGNDG
jgi:excisionase family DNA binding protein